VEQKRLQILHCLGWVASGGVEELRVMSAEGLDLDKYEHILLCQSAMGPLQERLIARGWSIREVGFPTSKWDPRWFLRALKATSDLDPDIIHGAVSEGNILASMLSLRFPRAKVVKEETSDGTGRRLAGRLIAKMMYSRSDAVIAVSPAVEHYLLKELKVKPSRIRLLMNGVERPRSFTDQQIAEFREELGIADSTLVLGTVGRLQDSHKGQSKLLTALPELLGEFDDLVLVIVGEGPDLAHLRQISNRLGIETSVVFAGYRGKAEPFYRIMDVFVLASTMEAFGLVVAEAMLSRVPVIASAVGGIPYILDGGNCGTLVSPCDSVGLGRAIARLLRDLPSARVTAEKAYERAVSNFVSDRYVGDLERLWAELLKEDSRVGPF